MRVHKDVKESTIYALICPTTSKVRYIGQTSRNLDARLRAHLSEKMNKAKKEWIDDLLLDGKMPEIKEIETVDIDKSQKVEDYWICKYMDEGADLFNAPCLLGKEKTEKFN